VGTATQGKFVKHVSDVSACDPGAGGWYYELGGGTLSEIVVCPVTCSAVKDGGSSVKIVVGCPTIL